MAASSATMKDVEGRSNEMAARILQAARECFSRYGVHRTSMNDVAKTAGISRQTLYNTIPGRQELIEAVVVLRIEEMSEELRKVLEAQTTFVDAVVETSLASVELARMDPELTNLMETATTIRLFEIIAGPFPAIHASVAALFRPLFAQARRSGELRADVSDDELVDWIRTVYLSLILRADLDADALRRVVRTFLVPSMTCAPPLPPRPTAVRAKGQGTPKRRKAT
ncbi:MAG: TetR/AcrR family transcriptional regulator [Actinobacteria bacterium]|nr:TetR/AcrR family transcriptional regulator [Actinomycetota bacterium]